jgi:hypothetical protein
MALLVDTLLKMRRPTLPSAIEIQAVPLDAALGVSEDAWTKEAAQAIVRHLAGTNIVILGGDVVRRVGTDLEYAHANWHYDPVGDDKIADAEESHSITLDYLRQFPDPQDGSVLYVLVFQDPDLEVSSARDALVELYPAFWREYQASSMYDADLTYVHLGGLAQHLVDLLQADETHTFEGFFGSVEQLLSTATPPQRDLLIVGFLETLQNVSLNRGMPLVRWERWLRPLSLEAWQVLIALWDARCSGPEFGQFVRRGVRFRAPRIVQWTRHSYARLRKLFARRPAL